MRWRTRLTVADLQIEREAIALFEQLVDLAEDERAARLAAVAAASPDLAARVAALLSAHAASELRTGGVSGLIEETAPPDRLGAYRLVERIGRGGMGAVYKAIRVAGDFDHIVAIKIIRPGPDSDRLAERFRGERRLLARLIHPHLAQLYDGGETPDGAPYFVMEYVDGVPLGRWLDERSPSAGERARIFAEVCAAVGYAHANLVVHRDLTPSNVLVTSQGSAKLIDFGIARAPEDETAERERSSLGSLSLTPGYAAPERFTTGAVTTASDIYSLGKLAEALFPDAAGNRDFAAICARATAADPGERYATVDALAADLAAWRGGFPVQARGGGRGYVTRRFVRRNRWTVAAAAAALVLIGTAWVRTQLAREAEAERFAQLRSLATYMLFDLNEVLSRVPGNTAARSSLAGRAQGYLDVLAAASGSDELRRETAEGLIQLARIQGVPDEPNLGQPSQAEANLARARAILADLPASPRTTTDDARAMIFSGLIAMHANARQDEALAAFERAGKALGSVPEGQRDAHWHMARRAQRLASLEFADVSEQRDRIPALAALLRADRAAWPSTLRSQDYDERDEAVAAYYEALRLSFDDDSRSTELFLANEKRFDALLARQPNDAYLLYRAVWNEFDAFAAASRFGREDQSSRLIAKANQRVDALRAIDPQDSSVQALAANVKEGLSQALRDADRFAEAIAMQQQVVAGRRQQLTVARKARAVGNLGFSLSILAIIARDAGQRDLACASYREAADLFDEVQRRGEILGFQKNLLAGLRDKRKACLSGGSIAGALRQ